ncbi:MAG: hypothetical protein IJB10_03185 [Clostridia bacterium]|nr:hypothetical protein [Clostridia bacterium]
MGFFDFLMDWKIMKDIEKEELSEEDELVDLMYINEQFEKERQEKTKNKKDEDWKR